MGAGVRFKDLIGTLAEYGQAAMTGDCPTVGAWGFAAAAAAAAVVALLLPPRWWRCCCRFGGDVAAAAAVVMPLLPLRW